MSMPPGESPLRQNERRNLFDKGIDAYPEQGNDSHEYPTENNGGPFYKLDDACECFVGLSQICLDKVESATHHCEGIVKPADHGKYIGDDVYR